MKIISKLKENKIIVYILVIASIYISANPLFHFNRYKQSVMVVFAISLLSFILYVSNISIDRNSFTVFLTLFALVLCTPVFTGALKTSTYISIILQICSAMFISEIAEFDEFESVYIRVISFLMICSLIFYFAQIISPDIWTYFPREEGPYFTYVNVGYIYNYFYFPSEGAYILPRNSGVFWEPGCYQFFLNMALILLLNRERKKQTVIRKRTFFLVVLYIITLITTKSTTGLYLLIIILAFNLNYILSIIYSRKSPASNKIIIIIGLVFAFGFSIAYNLDNDIYESLTKINSSEYMGDEGITKRLSLDAITLVFENFYKIFGISFETLYALPKYNVWNSIIEDALALGIPFVSIVLYGLFKFGMKHNHSNKLLILIVFIASLSAESLFHTIIMFIFMFYGIKKKEEKLEWVNKYENSHLL